MIKPISPNEIIPVSVSPKIVFLDEKIIEKTNKLLKERFNVQSFNVKIYNNEINVPTEAIPLFIKKYEGCGWVVHYSPPAPQRLDFNPMEDYPDTGSFGFFQQRMK